VINASIKFSITINSSFSLTSINISPAAAISDIGHFSLSKAAKSAYIFFSAAISYLRIKPNLVYMTLPPTGLAFYKDGLIALLLKAFGARIVIHLHGKGILPTRRSNKLKSWFYHRVFSDVDVIHLSSKLANDVAGLVSSNRIHIVNNGIHPILSEKTNRACTAPVHLLYLSNLVREKGALDLLNACGLLRDIEGSFNLVMAGKFYNAEFERQFRARFEELALGNVTLLDHGAYGEDKIKLFSESHVLVLPTYYPNECFPLTLLEAMSARMAIISTDEGAISDMVSPSENGLLVEKQNPESIADAMRHFIENPHEAQRMGEAGYQRYNERYTFEIFEQRLVSVLQEIANRK
jgi:glycosyltransferase involved in cell wall biosynthesis